MKYRIYKLVSNNIEYYIVKQKKLFGLFYGLPTNNFLLEFGGGPSGFRGATYKAFQTLEDAQEAIKKSRRCDMTYVVAESN